jgi:hypothetical protein
MQYYLNIPKFLKPFPLYLWAYVAIIKCYVSCGAQNTVLI